MVLKRVIDFLATLLMLTMIGFLIIYACSCLVLQTIRPMFYVEGNSMIPTLYDGDLIFVKPVKDPCEVGVNDIIVFNSPVGRVVHRVISKFNRAGTWYFITKGDNNPRPDFWITSQKDIIGIVVEVDLLGHETPLRIPLVGYAVMAYDRVTSGPYGTLFLVVTYTVLIVAFVYSILADILPKREV